MPAAGEVRRCRDCNTLFTIQDDHVQWFKNKGLFLPARCLPCLDKRKKRNKKAPQQSGDTTPEVFDPTPRMASVTFDADLLELLQDAAESFDLLHKALAGKPIQELTTFKDLDRLFSTGAELIASLKMNGFLTNEEPDQGEEEVGESLLDARTLAERLRSAGLKVESASPQKTEEQAPAETEVEESPPSMKAAQASQ